MFESLKALCAANKVQTVVFRRLRGGFSPSVPLMEMPHSRGSLPHCLCCHSVVTKVLTDGKLAKNRRKVTDATYVLVIEIDDSGTSRLLKLLLWGGANEKEVRDALSLQFPQMEGVEGKYSMTILQKAANEG